MIIDDYLCRVAALAEYISYLTSILIVITVYKLKYASKIYAVT